MQFRRTAIAAALIAAPLAFAAPASADPSFDCSPCALPSWEDTWPGGDAQGPWEKAFANGPWEKAFGGTDGKGAWENAQSGAWEKAFPPAE